MMFDSGVNFLMAHGYVVMLFAMIFEGPTVTTLAAFAASLGAFNIFIVFILSLIGDIVADVFFFYMWRAGKNLLPEKYQKFFEIKTGTISQLSSHLDKHFGKTLLIFKLTPILALPGITAIGVSNVSFSRFMSYSLAIIIPKSLIFLGLGYFSGLVFDTIVKYLGVGQWAIAVAVLFIFLLMFLFKKFSELSGRKLQD